jgi:hypothetical protein
MADLFQKTSLLEDNIKKLLALHQSHKVKFNLLETENKQLKAIIQEQQEHIRQLQDGKLAQEIAGRLKENPQGGKTVELKKQIDLMIAEIDQCITALNA